MSRKFKRRQTANGQRSTANGRHNAAFTLIEVLVAFLIMSVGLLGILVLFPVGIMASARSSNISRSAVVARGAVDILTNGGLGDAALTAALDGESGPWFVPHLETGTVTSSTLTSLTDSSKSWTINEWAGATVGVDTNGDGIADQIRTINSNFPGTLFVNSPWGTSPAEGDAYWIYPITDAQGLEDDGLILIGTPVDGDGDGTTDVILCNEATAFSWNATVYNAVDEDGNPIQGLYAVQIRVFRNFAALDGPGTATFTEGDNTVSGTGTNWVTGRAVVVGYYIRCEPDDDDPYDTDADGLWYEVSAINSDTELVLRRPYYGDGDTNLGESFSGKDYVITKSLIAVYDTYLAAR